MISRVKRPLIVLAKYLIAVGLMALVLRKIDTTQVLVYMRQLQPAELVSCIVLLNIAQVISALRMRYYLRESGLTIPPQLAIVLYYVGMFYNTILPGGVGGDGYKILLLKRKYAFPALKALRALLSERTSGLLILCIILFSAMWITHVVNINPWFWGATLAASILVVPVYLLVVRILLKERFRTALGAVKYSVIIQFFTCAAAYCLFYGLHITPWLMYLGIFLMASILSVIMPISVGGVGIREWTFVYGAKFFDLNAESGVAFSLIYYVIYMFSSLAGIAFLHKISHSHPQPVAEPVPAPENVDP